MIDYSSFPTIQTILNSIQNGTAYHFGDGQWLIWNLCNHCHNQQWKIKQLWIHCNYHSQILKDIENCSFPFLKTLYIYHNYISSIQCLGRTNLPSLTTFSANDNLLTNIQCLKKTNWPHIKKIFLCNKCLKEGSNEIVDSKLLYSLPIKEEIEIILQHCKENNCQIYDGCWIAKIESRSIKGLGLMSEERIKQQKVKECLKRKYLKLKINVSQ